MISNKDGESSTRITSSSNLRNLQIEGCAMSWVINAISNKARIRIMEMLEDEEMNIQTIQKRLNLSKTAVLTHLKLLEKAGFISTYYLSGASRRQKYCRKEYDRLIFNFTPDKWLGEEPPTYYEINIPLGNFFNFEIFPPCGLATKENVIKRWDDPSVFFSPKRIRASLLWCSYGFVEYRIPLNIPFEDQGFSKLQITLELSSQGGISNHQMLVLPQGFLKKHLDKYSASDITFWLNGIDVAKYTVADEYALNKERRGKLTPHWWIGSNYGELINIEINHEGTFINDKQASRLNIENILPHRVLVKNLKMKRMQISGDSLSFRIGFSKKAEHISGFTLYGRNFGDYPTDISVRFFQ
jgi:predicted transcriptional regulator